MTVGCKTYQCLTCNQTGMRMFDQKTCGYCGSETIADLIFVERQPDILQDYLGDGAYVAFDGHGIDLRANHHENPTDRVYLEPSVMEALMRFIRRTERFDTKKLAKILTGE